MGGSIAKDQKKIYALRVTYNPENEKLVSLLRARLNNGFLFWRHSGRVSFFSATPFTSISKNTRFPPLLLQYAPVVPGNKAKLQGSFTNN